MVINVSAVGSEVLTLGAGLGKPAYTAIPIDEIDKTEWFNYLMSLMKAAIEHGLSSISSTKDLLVKDLEPSDLGLSGDWSFSISATGENKVISDYTTPDDTVILIFGVYSYDTTKIVNKIAIGVGGGVKTFAYFDRMYMYDRQIAVFTRPYSIAPKTTIYVSLYAVTTGTTKTALMGFVVAPASKYVAS